VIELVDVRKAFNQGQHNELWAVRGITLNLEANCTTVLRGPSGSGKTTLMTLIGCLARPTSGRVRLRGRDVSGMTERFLTGLRRQTFGFVFQQFNLVRGLTVEENVMLPAYPLGVPRAELRRRARSLLESLDLAAHGHAKAEWLSGGQAQRAAIARALVNDPDVILADEPTANLDTELSQRFLDIVRDLKRQGKTLIMTSHDPLVYQAPEVDRVVGLRDGHLA
jgi:putative ABC transport system ATP-binding protein